MDSIAITLVSMVVEFGVRGNKKDVEAKLGLPSLPATILFNNERIEGQHQGLRAVGEGKRSWGSLGTLRYEVEASGAGRFISADLIFEGSFFRGKMHDTTGKATCTIDTSRRYTGSFEDGHLSGPGVMENFIDGDWRATFRGTWKMSKPGTGTHYDSAGNQMMTVHEGTVTSVVAASSAAVPRLEADRVPPVSPTPERLSAVDVSHAESVGMLSVPVDVVCSEQSSALDDFASATPGEFAQTEQGFH